MVAIRAAVNAAVERTPFASTNVYTKENRRAGLLAGAFLFLGLGFELMKRRGSFERCANWIHRGTTAAAIVTVAAGEKFFVVNRGIKAWADQCTAPLRNDDEAEPTLDAVKLRGLQQDSVQPLGLASYYKGKHFPIDQACRNLAQLTPKALKGAIGNEVSAIPYYIDWKVTGGYGGNYLQNAWTMAHNSATLAIAEIWVKFTEEGDAPSLRSPAEARDYIETLGEHDRTRLRDALRFGHLVYSVQRGGAKNPSKAAEIGSREYTEDWNSEEAQTLWYGGDSDPIRTAYNEYVGQVATTLAFVEAPCADKTPLAFDEKGGRFQLADLSLIATQKRTAVSDPTASPAPQRPPEGGDHGETF